MAPFFLEPWLQETVMSNYEELKKELEQLRDEIKLKMHLASMDAKEEWSGLEKRMNDFSTRARLHESSASVGDAAGKLGGELKHAFKRFLDALD
jgi:hypothetical protein